MRSFPMPAIAGEARNEHATTRLPHTHDRCRGAVREGRQHNPLPGCLHPRLGWLAQADTARSLGRRGGTRSGGTRSGGTRGGGCPEHGTAGIPSLVAGRSTRAVARVHRCCGHRGAPRRGHDRAGAPRGDPAGAGRDQRHVVAHAPPAHGPGGHGRDADLRSDRRGRGLVRRAHHPSRPQGVGPAARRADHRPALRDELRVGEHRNTTARVLRRDWRHRVLVLPDRVPPRRRRIARPRPCARRIGAVARAERAPDVLARRAPTTAAGAAGWTAARRARRARGVRRVRRVPVSDVRARHLRAIPDQFQRVRRSRPVVLLDRPLRDRALR